MDFRSLTRNTSQRFPNTQEPWALLFLLITCTALITLTSASWWSLLSSGIAITGYLIVRLQQRSEDDSVQLDEQATPPPEQEKVLTTQPVQTNAEAHPRVLFLSNDELDQHLVNTWLIGWQVNFTHCKNTVRAFAELIAGGEEERPYDIIITDQSGMDIDPIQFATSLRHEKTLNSTYLINMGPRGNNLNDSALLGAGYNSIQHFPLDKRALFNTIKGHRTGDTMHVGIPRLSDQFTTTQHIPSLDILIAESKRSDQFRLKHILQQLGHRVYCVLNGEEALEALETHHFDAAILSADLKGIDGLTIIKLYRYSRMSQAWIPLIALIDPQNDDHIHQCDEADILLRLHQPTTTKEVDATIHSALLENNQPNDITPLNAYGNYSINHVEPHSIDVERLEELEQLNSDKDFVPRLIKRFDVESLDIISNLKSAQSSGKLEDIRMLGHRLKDSAGSLGALGLYRQGVLVSQLSQQDLTETATHLIKNIEKCRRFTLQFLTEHTARTQQITFPVDKD